MDIEHDFSNLPITRSVVDEYPELKEVFGDSDVGEPVLRYIIAYYNKRSPLRNISDLAKRKHDAVAMAGIPMINGKFPKDIEDILFGRNNEVNELIISYAHSQGSSEFIMLAGYEQALYGLTLGLLENSIDRYTIKMMTEIQEEIDKLKDTLLAKDRFIGLEKTLYKNTSKVKIDRLRPEFIAQKLRDGEPPVDIAPYGKDYTFEKHGTKGRIPDLRAIDKG